MNRKLLNRSVYGIIALLLVSILMLACILIVVIYKHTLNTVANDLQGVVNRQKTLVTALHNQGKEPAEIIAFIDKMKQQEYGIGLKGGFVIGEKRKDSINK
jgi:hypothetical protein